MTSKSSVRCLGVVIQNDLGGGAEEVPMPDTCRARLPRTRSVFIDNGDLDSPARSSCASIRLSSTPYCSSPGTESLLSGISSSSEAPLLPFSFPMAASLELSLSLTLNTNPEGRTHRQLRAEVPWAISAFLGQAPPYILATTWNDLPIAARRCGTLVSCAGSSIPLCPHNL